jgi:MFS transporter, PAT family, beta-lactamase induction signal transducer AmpG
LLLNGFVPGSDSSSIAASEKATSLQPVSRSPWSWIPSLYIAEGLPYVVAMTVSVIMFKGLGISNTKIALYTSWLYLPWVIKPFWSPLVDILKTRRQWIWLMQFVIGASLAGVALTLQTPRPFQYSLAFLWLLAFSSATHDIGADGFYLLALNEQQQAFFSGIRNTFYRLATIAGQGLLVMFAGAIQSHTGMPRIEAHVSAIAGAPLIQSIPTDWRVSPSPAQRELFLVTRSDAIEINSEPRPQQDLASLIAAARDRNITNGFRAPEPKRDEAIKTSGWWTRFVSEPLGAWLQQRFGEDRTRSDLAGNIGLLEFQLSKAPSEEVTVTLNLKSGDPGFAVAEGSRLTFNATNWNRPATVVFQLDPRLPAGASAVYELRSGNIRLSWLTAFLLLAAVLASFGIYHRFILPRPARDQPGEIRTAIHFVREFLGTFGKFFRKSKIPVLLLFLLFYRFAEAQLVKMVAPFLLDGREVGGLGLTTAQAGFVYGTVGILALTVGGILGGVLASRQGLKFWLWPMVLVMHLPDAAFVYLAHAQPHNLGIISTCVAVEQFGYGFGFTAYMLYMLYIARGEHSTAHYAICTGFMALGMMLPGMWSGWLQDHIGYKHFFVWVLLATIPGFIVTALVPLDREFGKSKT